MPERKLPMTYAHHHDERDAHDHGDPHAHTLTSNDPGTRRALTLTLLMTGSFAVIEAIGGYLTGSLALLSDAGHMATDAAAIGVALLADAIGRRPASNKASYGHGRAEVLAAFINALAMLAVVAAIAIEAVRRLLHPAPVAGAGVVIIALAGLAVNLVAAWILSRAPGSLNARGALLHVVSDALGSLAAVIAGGVILSTGWTPIDPILSLLVVILILRSTWQLLKRSTGVLMEHVPAHLDFAAIGRALAQVPGVTEIHDLHVWHMTADEVALSAHVSLARADDWLPVLAAAQRMLAERFGIRHATLQPSWPAPASALERRGVIPLTPARFGDRQN